MIELSDFQIWVPLNTPRPLKGGCCPMKRKAKEKKAHE